MAPASTIRTASGVLQEPQGPASCRGHSRQQAVSGTSILPFDASYRGPKTWVWGPHLLEAGPDCTHSALESEPSPRVPPVQLTEPSTPPNVAQGDRDSHLLAALRKAPMVWSEGVGEPMAPRKAFAVLGSWDQPKPEPTARTGGSLGLCQRRGCCFSWGPTLRPQDTRSTVIVGGSVSCSPWDWPSASLQVQGEVRGLQG